MSEENATDVVIVGGSTKIPFVKSMLESHFNTTLCEKVDKDTGIAQGAALYAAFMYSNLTEFSGPLQDTTAKMMVVRKESGETKILWRPNANFPLSKDIPVETT